MTGPKPLPKRFLHIVRSRASSFNWQNPLLSLRSSSSFLRLLPRLVVTSICPFIFPSITCFRRQFLRKMWPIQLAFRFPCLCIYIIYTHIYIYTNTHTHTHTHTLTYIWLRRSLRPIQIQHVEASNKAFVMYCTNRYIYIYVCVCVCVHTHTYICLRRSLRPIQIQNIEASNKAFAVYCTNWKIL